MSLGPKLPLFDTSGPFEVHDSCMSQTPKNQVLTAEQALSDLNWVIGSAALQNHICSLHGLSPLQSVDPVHLMEFLQQRFCVPVGRYFEWVVHYYLEHCLQLDLIAHGKQIQVGNRTVGELDFLFRHDDQICHLETAVKFYLYMEQPHSSGSHFPGPNAADNFESKLQRLMTHQLPLSKKHAPEVTQRQAFVKGMIFYRPGCVAPEKLPEGMSADHCRGTWIRSTELSALQTLAKSIDADSECRFHLRRKPHWLANDSLPFDHQNLLTVEQAETTLNAYFETDGRPCMVSALRKGKDRFEEFERIMIVDHIWPDARERKFG